MKLSGVMADIKARIPGFSSGPSAKYASLDTASSTIDVAGDDEPRDAPWGVRNRRLFRIATLTLAASLVAYMILSSGLGFDYASYPQKVSTQLWGQYSPYFPVPSEIDSAVPEGCTVTFAQVLSRHGARDPTLYKTEIYNATIAKIKTGATKFGKGYEFLKDLEYTLGADQLTAFGIEQMLDQGREVAQRYGHLAFAADNLPFIRASGQERVIDSAENWAHGFYGELVAGDGGPVPDEEEYLGSILIVPETAGFNNTLDHGRCSQFEEGPESQVGNQARNAFADKFTPPVIQRLRDNLGGDLALTRDDAINIMDLCPFYTVANPNPQTDMSDFCHLFTHDEWKSYDYYQSLGKYYGYANGNPLGPTQGVGFVNELVSRLTRRPVQDHTSTNSTLTGSPDTFPLDRALYADFSHDNTMLSIYAALGLYNLTEPLPRLERTSPRETHGFAASWTVPFAGRMFVEKMTCSGEGEEELVRVIVNDRVVPLQGCEADGLGRCRLGHFIEGLSFARSGGRWDQCFLDDHDTRMRRDLEG